MPNYKAGRFLIAKKESTPEDPDWYKLYYDGRVEQGGHIGPMKGNTTTTVMFPIVMKSTQYMITVQIVNQSSGSPYPLAVLSYYTDQAKFRTESNPGVDVPWLVMGYNDPTRYSFTGEVTCIKY